LTFVQSSAGIRSAPVRQGQEEVTHFHRRGCWKASISSGLFSECWKWGL